MEVATFRSDAGYADGRHPDQVTYASYGGGSKAAGLHVNGLLMRHNSGEVLDSWWTSGFARGNNPRDWRAGPEIR